MGARDIRRIPMTEKSKELIVEGPGFTVHIHPGLHDAEGRPVTAVSVLADGDRFAGESEYWVEGERGNKGQGFRIIRTTGQGG